MNRQAVRHVTACNISFTVESCESPPGYLPLPEAGHSMRRLIRGRSAHRALTCEESIRRVCERPVRRVRGLSVRCVCGRSVRCVCGRPSRPAREWPARCARERPTPSIGRPCELTKRPFPALRCRPGARPPRFPRPYRRCRSRRSAPGRCGNRPRLGRFPHRRQRRRAAGAYGVRPGDRCSGRTRRRHRLQGNPLRGLHRRGEPLARARGPHRPGRASARRTPGVRHARSPSRAWPPTRCPR